MLLDVTRHPYSFLGDHRGSGPGLSGWKTPEGKEPTWHESLLGYCNNSEERRKNAEEGMRMLGRTCGIELDYNVQTNWQPVDSQRIMLWANKSGKQEEYMTALGKKHFEQRKSASHRRTILEAVEEVGLDPKAAEALLNTNAFQDQVWESYGSTIHEKGIHAIPFFCFNSPLTDGGPFRSGRGKAEIVNGSGDPQQFLEVFEKMLHSVERASL